MNPENDCHSSSFLLSHSVALLFDADGSMNFALDDLVNSIFVIRAVLSV